MGFWSSIGGIFSGTTEKPEKTENDLRKEHGFKGFDEKMKALKNFDPEAELSKLRVGTERFDAERKIKEKK